MNALWAPLRWTSNDNNMIKHNKIRKAGKNMNNDIKKLTRSRMNRMICGVCGGLGNYLGIDPTIVRIIWLMLSIGGFGTGFIIYFIVAVIIPEE